MAIDINYKVTGLETLEGSLNNLANSLNTLQTALTGTKNQESNVGSNKNQNVNTATSEVIHADKMFSGGSGNKITDSIDSSVTKSTKQNESFFSKLDKLNQNLDKLHQSTKDLVDVTGKGVSRAKDTESSEQSPSGILSKNSISKGLILGAEALVAYQANTVGKLFGSASGTLNTGLGDYSDFIKDYNSKIISAQSTGAATTGYVLGFGSANILAEKGRIGAAIVVAATTLAAEAFSGYETDKKQAQNELASNQDRDFYRLSSIGYRNANAQLNISALFGNNLARSNLTELQDYSFRNKGYVSTIGETALSGRRDVISDLTVPNLSKFNDNLNKLSLLTGVSIGNLSSLATQYSKVSGSSIDETLKQLNENFAEFGGNTAANTAEMVKLLQSTSMSPAEARNAVNTLQYNDTALANLIGVKSASPLASFSASILGRIGGLSQKELDTGVLSPEHRDELIDAQTKGRRGVLDTNSIISTYRMMALGQLGANSFATGAGNMESSQNKYTGVPDTDMMKEYKKKLLDSLGEIHIDTQNVNNPSQVNIYMKDGKVTTNGIPSKTGRKYVDNGIY